MVKTNLLQVCLHDLGAVVDSQNNVRDTSIGEGLNLVLDHGFVGELDEGLGEGQGLCGAQVSAWYSQLNSLLPSVAILERQRSE